MRKCNAAIELLYGVCNGALSMKKQYVQEMYETYLRQQDIVKRAEATRGAGIRGEVDLGGDLELNAFERLNVPIERITDKIFDIATLSGRPRGAISVLRQSLSSLNDTIATRNAVLAELIASGLTMSEKVPIIFAVPKNGSIDGRLEAAVKNIYERTDDCIYYSWILIEDIAKQGRRVRAQFGRKMRRRLPNVHAPIFSEAVRLGLMPAEDKYADWNSAFITRVPRTKGRWIGRAVLAVRRRCRQFMRLAGRSPVW